MRNYIYIPIIFCLFFIIQNNDGYAQTKDLQSYAAIPVQSPNVAALNKFVEFPVDKFNGQANASIPLYEIALKHVTLPINLKYHTGGIRVREEASWVGLGWALEAGGVISHQINGMDDLSGINPFFGQYLPFSNASQNQTYFDGMGAVVISGDLLYNKNLVQENIVRKFIASNKRTDGEPDLYIYNMGSYSGKFITWNNEKVDLNCNNIIFKQHIGTGIIGDSIIATTPEGNIYKFKDIENSVTIVGLSGDSEDDRSKAVAYYLSEILCPNGERIKFHYKTFRQICDEKGWGGNFPDYSKTFIYSGYYPQAPDISESCYLDALDIPTAISYTRLRSNTFSKIQYLEKIEFPNGTVEFIKSPRLDMYGLKLDKVYIKNGNGEKVKTFTFTYDYFNGLTAGGGYDAQTATNVSASLTINYPTDYTRKRLKLVSFSEVDNVNEAKGDSYNFTYNEEYVLPNKTSFAQDFWGYYNGKSLNKTLLPSYAMYSNVLGIPGPNIYATADRDVDEYRIKAGIIKTITHPTGVTTSFEFEPNECINSVLTATGTEKKYYSVTDIGVGYSQTEFTFTARTTVDISVLLMKENSNVTVGSYFGAVTPSYFFAQLEKRSTTGNTWIHIDKYFWGGAQYLTSTNVYSGGLKNEVLEAGTYRLTANFPDNHASLGSLGSNMANISVSYNQEVTNAKKLVGGLRVKKILNPIKGPSVEYTYNNGILMTHPTFTYSYTYSDISVKPYGYKKRTYIMGNPVHPYSLAANGGLVGYRNITERLINGVFGRIEYDYEAFADVSGIGAPSFLAGIKTTSYLKNGFLYQKRTYDNDGKLKITNKYEYAIVNPKVYWGFKITPAFNHYVGGVVENENLHTLSGQVKTYFYPIVQGKLVTKSEHESLTDVDITAPYDSSTGYEYNSYGFLKLKRFKTGATGTRTESYLYSADKKGESSIYGQMASNNILSPMIEVTTDNNGSISKLKTNYSQQYAKIFKPANIQLQKGTNAIETRITYERYDSYGNPNSINKDGLGNTIYLWGYKGQYLVAEIKYSDYTTVNTALSSVGLGSIEALATNANPDKTKLDKLRDVSTLANTHITTYKYFPLVGITEETSPSKVSTYYTYDNFRRLKEIYYYENNDTSKKRVVSTYQYNYKNK